MKYIQNILLLLAALLAGCSDNDDPAIAKAVLASANTVSFEAQDASQKIITVYADALWHSEVPEWVSITPTTGVGTTDVTISVNDNLRDGAIDNPRKATLVFCGATLASRAEVLITQDGDKYRDCREYTLAELLTLPDETTVSLPEAIVVATGAAGFIATDAAGASNIYMQSGTTVTIGDRVSVKGTKGSDNYRLPQVSCDQVSVTGRASALPYPVADDITVLVDSYTATTRSYISVSGVLNGSNITIAGATFSVSLIDVPATLDLSTLNGHRVTVTGYYAGTAAPTVRLQPAAIDDLGVEEVIYFAEDFEWLLPWAESSGAGQTVENDGSGTAPQIYTAKNEAGQLASEALTERGYGLEEIPGHAIYLQRCYLKFGKTDYQAGLTLPSIDGIPAGTRLMLSFDWAPMVGGTRKFDPVQLIVTITNGDQVTELDPIGHSFVDTVDQLEWLHVELPIEGVDIDRETRISIKSDGWGDTKATTGSSVYRRWFIDNIKLRRAQ